VGVRFGVESEVASLKPGAKCLVFEYMTYKQHCHTLEETQVYEEVCIIAVATTVKDVSP